MSELRVNSINNLVGLNIIIPTGSVVANLTSTEPEGWLECDGSSLSTTTYAALFSVIGYTYGGSGANFTLPDFRGEFLRGWDHSAGTDPDAASRTNRGDGTTGDNVGTKQDHQIEAHTHTYMRFPAYASNAYSYSNGQQAQSQNTGSTGGNETRPVNVNVMWIIKY